jgi:hypothetical protein
LSDQILDRLLVARQAKEQIELVAPFQGAAVNRTLRILGFPGIILELFTGDAVPALLAPFADVAIGLNAGKELLDDAAVTPAPSAVR